MKRFLWAVFALAALAVPAAAQAGLIVETDSGSIGAFSAMNKGVVAGTATIVFDVPNVSAFMDSVNGGFIPPEATAVNAPVTMLVKMTSPDVYKVTLVPMTYVQTIGATVGMQAMLDFSLDRGATPNALNNFFNVSGFITSVAANSNPLFDFSNFKNTGTINITFTATTFGGGASDFVSFIATPGATAVGNGSFSEAVVPEPTSVLLMGLGLPAVAMTLVVSRRR
jgi:hypothetical protein